jgi:adenosylhomocysteine nucleosidase
LTGRRAIGHPELWECDLAVVTVQDRETAAVLRLVEDVTRWTAADGHAYYRFTVPTPPWHNRARLKGLVWPADDVGRVAAALGTRRLLAEVIPDLLVLVGVAGGFAKNGVDLGDVVIATSIVDYEMQRLSTRGPEFRLKSFDTTGELLSAARKTVLDFSSVPAGERPNVRLGIVMSGDKVIASEAVVASLLEIEPTAVAVEMEGAGVAAAVQETPLQNAFIMIRGIVDLANEGKREDAATWGDRACDAAATFMLAMAYRATSTNS